MKQNDFFPPLLVIVQKLLIPLAMYVEEKIGNVEKNQDEAEFEWKIPEFFSVAENKRTMEGPFFTFSDTELQFHLRPESEFVHLRLVQARNLESPVKYYFGLKKLDGSIEYLTKGFLNAKSDIYETNWIRHRFSKDLSFKLSEVQQRKSELAPLDVLTVTCILKCKTARSHQEKLLNPPKEHRLSNFGLFSEHMKDLFTVGQFSDVILNVKHKEFKAHKIILATRSPVFASYFEHETSEKQNGIINIPDCDPDSFKEFLEYLYSGKLESTSLRSVLHLYRTADKYDVQELKMFCIEYMKCNFNVEYFCDVLVLAEENGYANLFAAAQDFFNSNLGEIFATDEWMDLMKNNHNLANRLLMQMSKCVQVVSKRPRLQ